MKKTLEELLDDPEFLERVASKVHADWVEGKKADGFTTRLSETQEELMVDYNLLSEPAKELDRRTVRTIFKAIKNCSLRGDKAIKESV